MRTLLGLDATQSRATGKEVDEKRHQQFKDEIMSEIIDRTSRIREVGSRVCYGL